MPSSVAFWSRLTCDFQYRLTCDFQYRLTCDFQYRLICDFQYRLTCDFQYRLICDFQYRLTCDFQYRLTCDFQYRLTCDFQYRLTCDFQYRLTCDFQYRLICDFQYLGVYIDDVVNCKSHISFILTKCCQRIGMFKKVLSFFANDVALLYYNAFTKSCFSYCLMFCNNKMRSGRYKLIDKVNHLISLLAKRRNLTVEDYVRKTGISHVMLFVMLRKLLSCNVYHLCINSIMHNLNYLQFFSVTCNNFLHVHITQSSGSIHIKRVTALDQHNFMYHCILNWNICLLPYRQLHKKATINNCKALIFQ